MRSVKGWFRSLGYSIKNIVRWWKIIWNDRDWDYGFFEEILVFKLKNMRDFYQNGINVWSANAPQVADEISEVIEIFERIQEDNYENLVSPGFNDWIDKQHAVGESIFKTKINEDGEKTLTFNTPKWTEEEKKAREEVYIKAEEMHNEDYRKAFELIGRNIRKWWD